MFHHLRADIRDPQAERALLFRSGIGTRPIRSRNQPCVKFYDSRCAAAARPGHASSPGLVAGMIAAPGNGNKGTFRRI
jgi:hypothetical protein